MSLERDIARELDEDLRIVAGAIEESPDVPEETGFTITDDVAADWALSVIADEEAERDRLIEICNHKIEQLEKRIELFNERCENKTGFLKSKLLDYFDTVEHKHTKAQESYKLVSGSLVRKKPVTKIIKKDEAALIESLKDTEFVESVPKLKWADFKKTLAVMDGAVISTETGEIVEGCEAEYVPAEFTVKL